jgi:hypothetical protein
MHSVNVQVGGTYEYHCAENLNAVRSLSSDGCVLLSSSCGRQIAVMCVQDRLCNEPR